MDSSFLVRWLGFSATLIHGDTLVLDRWYWLRRRLPRTRNAERLLDVGCGTGAFTIGAARLGYHALGLSWDERNQRVAADRAGMTGAKQASFEIQDVRTLDERVDYRERFDIAICLECVEHILDDARLFRAMAACLKPGGRLLLTTPNYYYHAITPEDNGPFQTEEHGWHVRRGYSPAMFMELCRQAGLECEEISYCSGYLSQRITKLFRWAGKLHPRAGWLAILPLRWLPPLLDGLIDRITGWPNYSICLQAYKPRNLSAG